MEEYSKAVDRIIFLEEEHEILFEQLKSLEQEIHYERHQLKLTEDELNYTKQELCNAVILQKLELDEAKEFAKLLVESNNCVSESIAAILTNIYGILVKPEELEQIKKQENKKPTMEKSLKGAKDNIIAQAKELRNDTEKLKKRYKENEMRYVNFRARFLRQVEEFRAKRGMEDQVFTNDIESNYLSYSPPPRLN
jgi:hypothetical protein